MNTCHHYAQLQCHKSQQMRTPSRVTAILTVIESSDVHFSCLPREENTNNEENCFENIEGAGEVDFVCRATLPHFWCNVYLTFKVYELEQM